MGKKKVSQYEQYESYDSLWIALKDKYLGLAMNTFKYTNLPDEIRPRYIERPLHEEESMAFCYDSEKDLYIALPYAPSGNLNMYGEHIDYRVIAYAGGYNKEFKKFGTWAMYGGKLVQNDKNGPFDVAVEIRNTEMSVPTMDFVLIMITKMANVLFTLKYNTDAQKNPYILNVTQKDKNSLSKAYKAMESFEPIIIANKEKAALSEAFETFDTPTQFIGGELYGLFKSYESDLLSHMGINNSNINKQQRVQSSEVNANNDFINHNMMMMYDARVEYIGRVNEAFGLDIKVDINYDYIDLFIKELNKEIEMIGNGGNDNGTNTEDNIHST